MGGIDLDYVNEIVLSDLDIKSYMNFYMHNTMNFKADEKMR